MSCACRHKRSVEIVHTEVKVQVGSRDDGKDRRPYGTPFVTKIASSQVHLRTVSRRPERSRVDLTPLRSTREEQSLTSIREVSGRPDTAQVDPLDSRGISSSPTGKWSQVDPFQNDLRVWKCALNRKPSLAEQDEEGDFVSGDWSDYFTQLQTFVRDLTRQFGIARLPYAQYAVEGLELCNVTLDLKGVTPHHGH